MTHQPWSPTSWQTMQYDQAAEYTDTLALDHVVTELTSRPPLVTSGEVAALKKAIAKAGRGEAFILQGGDCAESFADCRATVISNKLKILLQMSVVLLHGLRKPIVRIGRIAGQYAKPRSSPLETINKVTLPSYRGDLINAPAFDKAARNPDPMRLLQGHACAAMTLNFIRGLLNGGFANLQYPEQWDLRFVQHSLQAKEYRTIVENITQSLEFLVAIDGLRSSHINKVDFYTSHEALQLHYEQALTRDVPQKGYYNLSTHFPWIGMRTAFSGSAHLESLRGIHNPVGVKVGPTVDKDWLQMIVNTLNPQAEPGKLVLITRLGASKVGDLLPPIIEAVQSFNVPVTWLCDPMHGNTESTADGTKTRRFDNILSELQQTAQLHKNLNSCLGGVHFELTGEDVTECVGGARGLDESDLKRAYHSLVDPRLNYEQSLEMAFLLSRTI